MSRIVLATATALLTACVPMLSHEYDVRGQGEKSVAAGCSQATEVVLTAHPNSDIAVVFRDGADRIRPDHRIVSVSFVLSGEESVKLTKPEVLVSSRSNSLPSAVPIAAIRRASGLSSPSCALSPDAVYQQPDEPMRRASASPSGDAGTGSVFVIDIVVSGDPREITVQLPPISIDDSLAELKPVTFTRKLAVIY